jgi:hypothetical protein
VTLNEKEQQSARETFSNYGTLLMKISFAIDNMNSAVQHYELPTFDFDRTRILRNPSDPIDVQPLSQLYQDAMELQPMVCELSALVERKGTRSVHEVTAILKEMSDVLINICQRLADHKGTADAMNRILRYGNEGREVHCYIDPEFISKLKQTTEYIKNCRDKAKRF